MKVFDNSLSNDAINYLIKTQAFNNNSIFHKNYILIDIR